MSSHDDIAPEDLAPASGSNSPEFASQHPYTRHTEQPSSARIRSSSDSGGGGGDDALDDDEYGSDVEDGEDDEEDSVDGSGHRHTSSSDRRIIFRNQTCCQRCRGACFICFKGSGECCATTCQRMSPKSIPGAKRCAVLAIILLIVAIGLIVQSFIIPTLLHDDLVRGLEDAQILADPSSTQFIKWLDNAANPLQLTGYVYHIVNPAEILQGAKPELIEMGPYVWHQRVQNYNISFGSDVKHLYPANDTSHPISTHRVLSYSAYTSYTFAPDMSVGSENDTLTTLNVPFVAFFGNALYGGERPFIKDVEFLFSDWGTYHNAPPDHMLFAHNRTVRDIFFGWDDPVLSLLHSSYTGFLKAVPTIEQNPPKKNVIYTGAADTLDQLRNYIEYHDQPYIATCPLPFPTDGCQEYLNIPGWNNNTNGPPTPESNGKPGDVSVLRGNDGSVFPTPINEQSTLTMFYPPLLRSIDLVYKQATNYKDVPLLQYGFPDTFWSNSEEYPPNAAYFQDGKNGLLNMTIMQGTIPIYISRPRFIGTDPTLSEGVNATYLPAPVAFPDTIFEVEPQSGVTFHIATTSQVNFLLGPIPDVPDLHNISENVTLFPNMTKNYYLPVMWAQEEGGIDDEDAKLITTVLSLIKISQVYGLIAGICLAVVAVIYLFLSWRAYDLESSRHLSAVRSLLGPNDTDASMSQAGFDGGSLLDSSILVMQEDPDAIHDTVPSPSHAGAYGQLNDQRERERRRRASSEVESVDIGAFRHNNGGGGGLSNPYSPDNNNNNSNNTSNLIPPQQPVASHLTKTQLSTSPSYGSSSDS